MYNYRIFSLLSQKIFDLLAHAKSHRELKRVVDLTECWLLSCDYGDLLSGLIVQELNPFRALGNIVTVIIAQHTHSFSLSR